MRVEAFISRTHRGEVRRLAALADAAGFDTFGALEIHNDLPKIPIIPSIPASRVTPEVLQLLEICCQHQAYIQHLRDAIARLKRQKGKAKDKPSKLENRDKDTEKAKRPKKRRKRSKTRELTIDETVCIPPADSPV